MKRDELLKPGSYAACPLAVLARKDLTGTAKLVYQAMASHLNNGDQWVWPSIARMAAMTGSGRTAVIAAVAELERGRLIQASREFGRSTRYSFLSPDSGNQYGNQTGTETRPVRKPDQSGKRTPTGPESGHEVLQGTTLLSPPTPPPPSSPSEPEPKTAETSDAASGHTSPVPPSETSQAGNPQSAIRNPRSARRAGTRRSEALEARQLAEAYRQKVQPGDRTCSPGGRAVRNVEALLRSRQATAESLMGCVEHYASAMEAEQTPPQYRKAGGNFFGRDGTWREWLEPLTQEELARRRDGTHRANAARAGQNGPGRGGFVPPGDFSGRDDAVLA